jgi:hypothetical protein
MSRLTAAQIISLGEYLNPDFDATSLTVPQLLGVLGFHNVKYASPYTKSKLVQQFNEEIKPQASKLTRERLKQENSLASDDGIIDGVTGKPIGGEKVSGEGYFTQLMAPTDRYSAVYSQMQGGDLPDERLVRLQRQNSHPFVPIRCGNSWLIRPLHRIDDYLSLRDVGLRHNPL